MSQSSQEIEPSQDPKPSKRHKKSRKHEEAITVPTSVLTINANFCPLGVQTHRGWITIVQKECTFLINYTPKVDVIDVHRLQHFLFLISSKYTNVDECCHDLHQMLQETLDPETLSTTLTSKSGSTLVTSSCTMPKAKKTKPAKKEDADEGEPEFEPQDE